MFLSNYIAFQHLMKSRKLQLLVNFAGPSGGSANCENATAFINTAASAEVGGVVIGYEADNEPAPWEIDQVKICTLPALLKATKNPNVDIGVGFAHMNEVASVANMTTSLNWHSYNGENNGGGLQGEITQLQKISNSFSPPKPLILTEWLARPAQPVGWRLSCDKG